MIALLLSALHEPAWAAGEQCSALIGKATINEVHRSGNHTRFIEVKLLDPSVRAEYPQWSLRFCANSGQKNASTHCRAVSLSDATVAHGTYPWIVLTEAGIPSDDYIELGHPKGGMEIRLNDADGRAIDYLSVADNSGSLNPGCNFAYDSRAAASNSHTLKRIQDGTGDWTAAPGNSQKPTKGTSNDGDGGGSTCSGGLTVEVPTFTAGQSASATVTACGAAFAGERNVAFWFSYEDPASGSKRLYLGGTELDDPTGLGDTVALTFDPEGKATVTLTYADVGKLRLYARYEGIVGGTPVTLEDDDDFVVKPHRFEISAITCADGTVNPKASTAAEGKFCKAGQEFTIEVKALNSLGTPTPNFGKEAEPESVELTAQPPLYLGLTEAPALSGSLEAFGAGCEGTPEPPKPGVACGTAFSWAEVGIITLKPSIKSGSYLNAGDVEEQTSVNVGRFYPHHFKIEEIVGSAGLIDRADINAGDTEAVCSTPFTYLDEEFKTRFQLTARNADMDVTQNYSGDFAKFPLSDWSAYGFVASGLPDGLGLVLESGSQDPTGTWIAGAADVTAHHKVRRPAGGSLAPPAAVEIQAAPNDGEATTASGTPEAPPGASTALRFGRLRLANVYGYYSPLEMAVEAQYWSGKSWVLNKDDDCTMIKNEDGNANLAANQPGWTLTAPGTLTAGRGTIALTLEPGAARSARICVDLGDDPASGVDCDAGTAAALPWLQGKWPPGAGHDNDPWATATFGVFRQESRKGIYNRELY